jgi:hypothetical protein
MWVYASKIEAHASSLEDSAGASFSSARAAVCTTAAEWCRRPTLARRRQQATYRDPLSEGWADFCSARNASTRLPQPLCRCDQPDGLQRKAMHAVFADLLPARKALPYAWTALPT